MDVGRALSWTAERFPERVGVVGRRSLTYQRWDARTNQIAHALTSLGARRGDRLALLLTNSEVLASTHLAAQKLGLMSTPLNVRLSPQEIGYCLGDADPSVLLTEDATAQLAEASLQVAGTSPPRVHEGDELPEGAAAFSDLVDGQSTGPPGIRVTDEDPSVMLYTSGTTGRPKGVPRTQRNEFSAAVAHVIQCRYESGESTLGAMPMYHTMGLRSLLSMVVVGGRFVTQPRFEPNQAIDLIKDERISALYLVPTAFWAIANSDRLDEIAGTVRKLAYAGAPMSSTLTRQLADALDPAVFVNHYGSSEVYTFSIEENAASKPGSAGRAALFGRLRVVRPGPPEEVGPEDAVGQGETGEIIVDLDSDEAFSGYWQRPDADAKALRSGWYFTGDLGYIDDDGDLWVAGRVDDMIITGGENVHPVEVEDILSACPEVAEAAVVGMPHEKWGQAVTAFVVPADPNASPELVAQRVMQWTRSGDRMSPYKTPKSIMVVDHIPKSPVGKLLRRKLVAGEYSALASHSAERTNGS